MKLLRGAEVSAKIREQILADLQRLDRVPQLAVVRVGEKPDDIAYERGATKKLQSFGLGVRSCVFPENIGDAEFCREFQKLNEDPEVTGILLLLPLPKQIDRKNIGLMIDPGKDMDGISPVNVAKVFAGEKDGFAPCTAEAVMEVLHANEIPVAGKRVTIVGRSMVVGRPLAMLMLAENATVTVCHTRTADLAAECSRADILVAAAGRARMLGAEHIGEGAVVLDVGINADADGKLCGDVDFPAAEQKASMATPVPGGVGAVTTAVLARHLVRAALAKTGEQGCRPQTVRDGQ